VWAQTADWLAPRSRRRTRARLSAASQALQRASRRREAGDPTL
jgi:hypothetical protein